MMARMSEIRNQESIERVGLLKCWLVSCQDFTRFFCVRFWGGNSARDFDHYRRCRLHDPNDTLQHRGSDEEAVLRRGLGPVLVGQNLFEPPARTCLTCPPKL
jgi:hypothetical protein